MSDQALPGGTLGSDGPARADRSARPAPTTHLLVQSPGAMATLQDLGRRGWRRLGVPTAGALDGGLLRLANRLAGNADDAPAIEFLVSGPTLAATDAPVRLGLAGQVSATLLRGDERRVLASWRSITLQPGDVLRIGQPQGSRVAYVAVAGLQVPRFMGSAATYTRARLGGLNGRALMAGDRLPVGAAANAAGDDGGAGRPSPNPSVERHLKPPPALPPKPLAPIRVVLGPQQDHFDEANLAAFLGGTYTVSREADRMGIRLEGPVLRHRADKGAEIVSDATLPGSVQVPGNGQPIVLLADGQTAGGYPKIATVASADLARLACAEVGAMLRFQAISVAQAEDLARAHEAEIQRLLAAVQPLTLGEDGIDLAALYEANLISAVVDARHPPE